jgi:beta-aspartyl-peptidase (threonine type)
MPVQLSRFVCRLLLALFAGWAWAGAAVASEGAEREGYEHYVIGDPSAERPGRVEPGLMLVGGGEWPYEAFRWMIERAGHGHIVVLSASGADEEQEEFYRAIGGIASAQTFVFSDRRAASDPEVLAAVAAADGLFIAGGDQSKYVRYWKDTPLAAAIDQHAREGKPLGGTSAGLAILGSWVYGAMDGGSLVSDTALRDPFGPQVTLVGDFLHLPYLDRVITDSHFDARGRLGRLVTWVARLQDSRPGIVGLGVDENTALCIDGQGRARVFTDTGGAAWLVRTGAPTKMERGPLNIAGVQVTGIGTRSGFDLESLAVTDPIFERVVDVRNGRLSIREASAPAASR